MNPNLWSEAVLYNGAKEKVVYLVYTTSGVLIRSQLLKSGVF